MCPIKRGIWKKNSSISPFSLCHGVSCALPNTGVEDLTPSISESDPIWKDGFKEVFKLKSDH